MGKKSRLKREAQLLRRRGSPRPPDAHSQPVEPELFLKAWDLYSAVIDGKLEGPEPKPFVIDLEDGQGPQQMAFTDQKSNRAMLAVCDMVQGGEVFFALSARLVASLTFLSQLLEPKAEAFRSVLIQRSLVFEDPQLRAWQLHRNLLRAFAVAEMGPELRFTTEGVLSCVTLS